MSFDVIVNAIGSGFSEFSYKDAFDIVLIAWLLYKVIIWTKETRAYQVLKGFGFLVAAYFASQILYLNTINFLLGALVQSGMVLLVILFQPEIRRAFEHIGRGKLFDKDTWSGFEAESVDIVHEIERALLSLSRRRVGALIVIEQNVALGDIIATGTRIEGIVSSSLIENIFEPNTPLHDGAMIIRNDTIVAAGCFLPLSDDTEVARELGTRHRAALGISSVSDSVTLVVSEETGIISHARDSKLVRYMDAKAINNLLESIFIKERVKPLTRLIRRNNNAK